VIGPGEPVPPAAVWLSSNDRRPTLLPDLLAGTSALLLFYLYDWSST
jgi:hypothetical protein